MTEALPLISRREYRPTKVCHSCYGHILTNVLLVDVLNIPGGQPDATATPSSLTGSNDIGQSLVPYDLFTQGVTADQFPIPNNVGVPFYNGGQDSIQQSDYNGHGECYILLPLVGYKLIIRIDSHAPQGWVNEAGVKLQPPPSIGLLDMESQPRKPTSMMQDTSDPNAEQVTEHILVLGG